MIKILLTVAAFGSVVSFAGFATAQGKPDEVSSQCAHRRVMPPDPRDDCGRKLRNDAQLGYGQGAASANDASGQAPGAGPGNGIGAGNGAGNGIGPGNGGGQGGGKGRR